MFAGNSRTKTIQYSSKHHITYHHLIFSQFGWRNQVQSWLVWTSAKHEFLPMAWSCMDESGLCSVDWSIKFNKFGNDWSTYHRPWVVTIAVLDPKQFEFLGQTPKNSRQGFTILFLDLDRLQNCKDFTQLASTCSSFQKRRWTTSATFSSSEMERNGVLMSPNSHALG